MVLAKSDAVQEWRNLLGHPNPARAREDSPNSLRARYGQDQMKNALHGSDHYHTAEKEIRFMFPQTITEPIYRGVLAKDYLNKYVNPVLVKGLTQLCKEKPQDGTVSVRIECNEVVVTSPSAIFDKNLRVVEPWFFYSNGD